MKHRKLFLLFALLLLALQSLPLTSAQDEPVVLRYPIYTDPEHLNPFTSQTVWAGLIIGNVYDGLVQYDSATDQVIPALAESWEITQDEAGREVYTFHLRQGVLFHEVPGVELSDEEREVTAETILWNYELALNGDKEISDVATLYQAILGAKAFTEGEADSVEGLAALDRYTFQITLETPDRLFLINGAGLAITSPAAYEQLGDQFNNIPVGTGPFRFVEWRRDDQLILEANPDYWREGFPKVDEIQFINYADPNTALLDYREDRLDFLFVIPSAQRPAIMEEFADEYHEEPSLHVRYFGFNMENGFLAENPLVRQALNYALDRETAWNILDEGARFPATAGLLPPSMPASTPSTVYTYDLEKAAQLLEEAGFPNGEGLPVITLNVLEGIDQEAHLLLWQQDLASIGVEMEFQVESNATYWDTILEEDTMIFQNGWAAGINDPADVFDYLILPDDGALKYSNPEVNELLRAARIERDEAARNALYQQAHDLIMADSVVIVSAYGKITWLQKPWVSGFVPGHGGTYTAPLEEASIDTAMRGDD